MTNPSGFNKEVICPISIFSLFSLHTMSAVGRAMQVCSVLDITYIVPLYWKMFNLLLGANTSLEAWKHSDLMIRI